MGCVLKRSLCLVSLGVLCFACGGCASPGPATPSFAAMPGRGKSYEAFQRDDQYCQSSAQQAIGYQSPGQAANQAAVGTAAVGTALGAVAGAAIGSVSGNMGTGAALGAGTGLVAGSAIGAGNAWAAAAHRSTVRREQPQAQGLTPHILRVPKIINRGRRRSFAAAEVASVVPTTRPTTSCARVPLPRRLQCRD